MRFAAIVALAVFGASCAGSDEASDRPRNSAADSAFHADSAILAAIVERDAAERRGGAGTQTSGRSEEHTSELQSQSNLVCRLLLEKKKIHHKEHRRCSSNIIC